MASTPSPVERPTVVDSSADVPAIQTDGAGETDENRTLLDLTDRRLNPEHRLAISGLTLLQINATAGDRRDPIDRATVDLNASLGSYRAHRPTDRAAFDRQADALHTLSNATGSEHDDRLANVSRGGDRGG